MPHIYGIDGETARLAERAAEITRSTAARNAAEVDQQARFPAESVAALAGEGLLGLQRAFQGAGARSVAASLWKVDDEFTQKLMTRFYAAAWDTKKPVSRAEALRQAQLALIREGDKDGPPRRLAPYFWAAFVLSGDWR